MGMAAIFAPITGIGNCDIGSLVVAKLRYAFRYGTER
jgi:hypothetical protein